jgi:hypothetical protein
VSPSVRMIIELNIKHYRDLLKTETDASKRQTVSQLLSQEEAKLAKLLTQEDKDKQSSRCDLGSNFSPATHASV